jgi:uncharacterized protein (TIGR02246 family)
MRILFILVAGMWPGWILAQEKPSPEPIALWAQQHTERWYAAFNAGDAGALVRMYAPDAVLLLQGQQFQGRTGIEATHRAIFEKADFTCTWMIERFSTVGALAVVAGSDSCAETSKSGGQVRSWKGRFLTVYQQQPDGSWMIVRDSGAEDRPPERPQPPPVAL